MSKLHSFLASCMRTRYTVDLPDGRYLALTIGAPDEELDRLLSDFPAETYAYLTAYNPQSTSLSPEENEERHARLCQDIRQRGFTYLTGKAIPESDAWEPEVCIFVFNMSRSVVRELCQCYAQDGALVGDRGSVPRLLFTNPLLREDFRTLLQNCVLD